MKITVMTAAAITLVSGAWAADQPGKTRVAVCISPGDDVISVDFAKRMATRMFLPAGVELEWHEYQRFCRGANHQIMIGLSNRTPADTMPRRFGLCAPV
jgi:hypothetical protein